MMVATGGSILEFFPRQKRLDRIQYRSFTLELDWWTN